MMIVNEEKCIGCGHCIKDCPMVAIIMTDEKKADVQNERCINCGHCIAICPQEAVYSDTLEMREVKSYDKESFHVDSEKLLNFIKFRRSIRHFKEQPVEKEKLLQLIEAGRFTATGSNSQDVSFVVVTETIGEVADSIYDVLKKKGEALIENPEKGTETTRRYAKMWVQMYDAYHTDKKNNDRLFFHAPTVIFVTANNPVNGALASSNMELMANASGLGCCFCGFALAALNDQPKLLEKLGIEKGKTLVSCLIVGYPDVKYKRTVPRNEASVIWK
jgi:nitroreductase/NAD-dependent dihydropyrimidine dehydrogenase PreA subunit